MITHKIDWMKGTMIEKTVFLFSKLIYKNSLFGYSYYCVIYFVFKDLNTSVEQFNPNGLNLKYEQFISNNQDNNWYNPTQVKQCRVCVWEREKEREKERRTVRNNLNKQREKIFTEINLEMKIWTPIMCKGRNIVNNSMTLCFNMGRNSITFSTNTFKNSNTGRSLRTVTWRFFVRAFSVPRFGANVLDSNPRSGGIF